MEFLPIVLACIGALGLLAIMLLVIALRLDTVPGGKGPPRRMPTSVRADSGRAAGGYKPKRSGERTASRAR